MMDAGSTARLASTADGRMAGGLLLADRLAAQIKRQWDQGRPADVASVLAEHPELHRYRSIVLDLAYAEYRWRQRAGEQLGAGEFSERFPSLQRSLFLLIQVQSLLEHEPGLREVRGDIPWPRVGDCFLGFCLTAELGRGTFGRVYLAQESALGKREVALKLAPGAGEEASLLGKLRHPNIVPVYSVQQDETTGLAAFCMPYLGRTTLADVLDGVFETAAPPQRASSIVDAIRRIDGVGDPAEPQPADPVLSRGTYLDGVLHLTAQLCDALDHAHRQGICHRDLKPSNVLLPRSGRPLLLDFNLAADGVLPPHRVGGTLPYMAPEHLAQLLQDGDGPDRPRPEPRCDLFSLGVVLYELLTGTLPFGPTGAEGSIREVAEQLRARQLQGPDPVRKRNPQVTRSVAQLLQECLSPEVDKRPRSASELAAALRRELRLRRRGQRWVRSHRRLLAALTGMLLAAVLVVLNLPAHSLPHHVPQQRQDLAQYQQVPRNPQVQRDPRPAAVVPPAQNAPKLRNGFQAGKQYAYEIKIEAELEDVIESREGVLIYNVLSASGEQVVLKSSGTLALRTKTRPGSGFRLGPPRFRGFPGFRGPPRFGPTGPDAITIDRQGKVVLSKPLTRLPFCLGNLETLVLEELPAETRPKWQKLRDVTTVETTPGAFPIGPLSQETITEWPAKEQLDYAVIQTRPEAVRIQKTLSLRSGQADGLPARFDVSGSGEFTFDLKAGLVSAMSMKYQMGLNQQNVSRRVPVTLTCRWLTPAELAEYRKRQEELRAAAEKANAPKPLEEGQRANLLEDLASQDTGRLKAAADRLAKSVVDHDPGPVATALAPLLRHADEWVQGAAAKALAVWASPEAEDALVEASASENVWVRASAIEALGKLKTRKAAEAVAAQMYRNRGEAAKALKAMGPVAETAALGCLKDRDQWVRRETCQVLAQIGGKASLQVLRQFAQRAAHFDQVEADKAIQAIQQRQGH